jgi:hypothetical protein
MVIGIPMMITKPRIQCSLSKVIDGLQYVWRVAWSARAISHQYPDVCGPPMTVVAAFRYAFMIAWQVRAFT